MTVATEPRREPAGEEASATRHLITEAELTALYLQLFRPLVRRAIRKHHLSNEDARDVVQEAFVIALLKLEPEGNAEAWFRRAVDNLAQNLRRKYARQSDLLARWSGSAETRETLSTSDCAFEDEGWVDED